MPSREWLKAIIDKTPDRARPLILAPLFTGLRGSELKCELYVSYAGRRAGKPPPGSCGEGDGDCVRTVL